MKSVGPIIDVYAAPRENTRRKVEKPNASSTMYGEREPPRGSKTVNATAGSPEPASRSGTQAAGHAVCEGVPSSFIAQILGQILATKSADAAAAKRAYEAVARSEPEKRFIRWA